MFSPDDEVYFTQPMCDWTDALLGQVAEVRQDTVIVRYGGSDLVFRPWQLRSEEMWMGEVAREKALSLAAAGKYPQAAELMLTAAVRFAQDAAKSAAALALAAKWEA